jgi:hypothetical protein
MIMAVAASLRNVTPDVVDEAVALASFSGRVEVDLDLVGAALTLALLVIAIGSSLIRSKHRCNASIGVVVPSLNPRRPS